VRIEGQGLIIVAGLVVFIREGDLVVFHPDEAVIGYGDAVGVAGEVVENGFGSRKRGFRIHYPFGLLTGLQEFCEMLGLGQRLDGAVKLELAVSKGLFQRGEKEAAKEAGQDADRQEESLFAGYPALGVRGQSAAGYDAMDMGVMVKGLAPRVQDGDETQLGAQMPGIRADAQQRPGYGAKEEFIDQAFVLESDGGQWSGQSEDDVIIRHGQHFVLSSLAPERLVQVLAFGAMTIAAGIVRDDFMAAMVTPVHVPAQRGGAA